ncbi:glycoside hydrolase [Russula compacta]|nr:glycoside hydrolase [Russula compacta]
MANNRPSTPSATKSLNSILVAHLARPGFLSAFMLSSHPSTAIIRRPLLRVLPFLLLFGLFFLVFLPPIDPPRYIPYLHWTRIQVKRPPTPTPPHFESHLHGIEVQRPVRRPNDNLRKDIWARRADAVREAFLQAYNSYLTFAAPHDELLPVRKTPIDNFNGWGLSYVDSLDTLWLMGLYEEFDGALAVVANTTFFMKENNHAPFFETVIRYLGGLLSAYALSHDPILLARADDLGTALLPVFDTPSGLPTYSVNTVSGSVSEGSAGAVAVLSEALTCQLEYQYLAYLTGRTEYYTAVERVMEVMYAANLSSWENLFPTLWSTNSGLPASTKVSVGALADSAYEYMLKQWLLSGRTNTKARDLYLRSANAILDHLTYITPTRNLLYVTDAHLNSSGVLDPTHIFEHLTCFLPGVLALGAATLPDVPRTHMWAARALAHTCWTLYADSPTGLSPDEVRMSTSPASAMNESHWDGLWATQLAQWERSGARGDPPGLWPAEPVNNNINSRDPREYSPTRPGYLLRPETVESFYLLWRTTGDAVWRERGWAVFEALVNATRVEGSGFASIRNVYRVGGSKMDQMPR